MGDNRMTDFYNAKCVKNMVENLKNCNRKLVGINNGINIFNEKIEGKSKNK